MKSDIELIEGLYRQVRGEKYEYNFRAALAALIGDVPRYIASEREKISVQAHPLGFLAFRWKLSSGRELRMHVWSRHFDWAQTPFWPIHDHNFSFASVVLQGSLLNRIYEIDINSPVGLRRTCGVYEVSYEGDVSRLRLVGGKICLLNKSIELIGQGGNYNLAAGVLHRSRLISENAITVLATWVMPEIEVARVIGNGVLPFQSFLRTSDSKIELSEVVEAVEEALVQ